MGLILQDRKNQSNKPITNLTLKETDEFNFTN